MHRGIVVGTGAGLMGGIAAAILLSLLGIKGPHGEITRAITLVSHTVRSERVVIGWLVQITVGAALGTLFGVLYAACGGRRESAAFWAVLYGLVAWIVCWFAVSPPPLRYRPWAALRDPTLLQLAMAGLLACLGFGAALAGAFTLFGRG
jgi:hypothetical protein